MFVLVFCIDYSYVIYLKLTISLLVALWNQMNLRATNGRLCLRITILIHNLHGL